MKKETLLKVCRSISDCIDFGKAMTFLNPNKIQRVLQDFEAQVRKDERGSWFTQEELKALLAVSRFANQTNRFNGIIKKLSELSTEKGTKLTEGESES